MSPELAVITDGWVTNVVLILKIPAKVFEELEDTLKKKVHIEEK